MQIVFSGAKINNKTLGLEGKQSDNEIDNNESGGKF